MPKNELVDVENWKTGTEVTEHEPLICMGVVVTPSQPADRSQPRPQGGADELLVSSVVNTSTAVCLS